MAAYKGPELRREWLNSKSGSEKLTVDVHAWKQRWNFLDRKYEPLDFVSLKKKPEIPKYTSAEENINRLIHDLMSAPPCLVLHAAYLEAVLHIFDLCRTDAEKSRSCTTLRTESRSINSEMSVYSTVAGPCFLDDLLQKYRMCAVLSRPVLGRLEVMDDLSSYWRSSGILSSIHLNFRTASRGRPFFAKLSSKLGLNNLKVISTSHRTPLRLIVLHCRF